MSYSYPPLNRREKEIRLLEILPAEQLDSSNIVHCLLHHYTLTSGVIFTALSYTWASEDDELEMAETSIDLPQNKDTQNSTGRIVVDGIELCVLANLESALQQVRQSLSSGSTLGSVRVAPGDQFPLGSVQPAGGVLIWADAVCINQRDATEKGHQVDLMHEIYCTAAQVVVWLGPAWNDSDFGMLVLATWGLIVDSGIFQLAGDLDQLVTSWLDPDFQYNGEHVSTVKTLRLLAGRTNDSHVSVPTSLVESLLQRRWWTRIWIIQEYVAAQNLNFWCGESIVPDKYMARAVAALEILGAIVVGLVERYGNAAAERLTMMEERIPRPHEIRLARKLVVTRSIEGASKPPLLDRLIWMGSDSNTTDRRDAVFALLGIAGDKKELGLKADYTLGVSDVYINTTMALAKAGNMEILSLAQSSESLVKDAPSWVPDWMTIRPRTTFSMVPNRTGNGAMNQLYSASGTTKESLRRESF